MSTLTDELRAMLARLGYDPRWYTSGLLDEATLQTQASELAAPHADTNTEHYRNRALKACLARGVTDAQLSTLVAVAVADPDRAFGDHVLHDVLASVEPGPIFEDIATTCEARRLGKFVQRARLLHRLRHGVDDALIADALAAADARVVDAVVAHPSIDDDQLREIAKDAPTRAMRTQAEARLRRRRDGTDRTPT